MSTLFVGAHYQVMDGVVTKYYLAGRQRLAMRTGTNPYYLLADHLGSTSLTTDASGNLVSELRYGTWGETRFESGTTPTAYRYTGQREETSFGLYFYQARWYDPYINHFAQADSVIPTAGDPQAWDRYAYANNSPLNYIDPTGHFGQCHGNQSGYQCKITQNKVVALERQWAAEKAAWEADEKAAQGRASLGDFFNCRNLNCDIGAEPGNSANFRSRTIARSPFACEWIDCALSAVGLLASGVAVAAIEVPPIAGVALAVDAVVTIWAIGRTEIDYAEGEISQTRRWTLNITAVFGLLPTTFGLGFSLGNTLFTFTGLPR